MQAIWLAFSLIFLLLPANCLYYLLVGWLAGLISVIPSAVTIDNIDTAPCQLT